MWYLPSQRQNSSAGRVKADVLDEIFARAPTHETLRTKQKCLKNIVFANDQWKDY